MSKGIAVILLGAFLFGLYLAYGSNGVSAKSCGASEYDGEGGSIGMANPAAVYCIEMGYEYKVIDDPSGQRGICIFPDGSQCNAWDFLKGKCGEKYSYCALNGYDMETRTDGQNPFSKEYAVCISQEGDLVGSVTGLMDLSEKCEKGSTAPPFENNRGAGQASLGLQVPSSFDWRNHDGYNWVTSVKSQGGCGSCWAFSVVGAVEAVHNIRYDNPGLDLDLSEQYLVSDCFSSGTCCGGWPYLALRYVKEEGIPDEGCMSYVDGAGCSCDNNCANCTYKTGGACSDATCSDRCADWQSRLVKIDTSEYVPNNPQTIKEYIIGKGPVSVVMGIGSSYGGYWDGDIYRCTNDNGTNHALVAVGYDDTGGYWIIKNSWGSGWNGDGYLKVGYGECNIENYVYYADWLDCGCTVASNTVLNKNIVDCSGDGLTVDADGITLDCNGHTIKGDSTGRGISLQNKSNVTVKNCNLQSFSNGIVLEQSSNNVLFNNKANDNSYIGIRLYESSDDTLINNTANNNYFRGIELSRSHDNTLSNDTASNNDNYGIVLNVSSGNILSNNTANNNDNYGICFWGGSGNILTNNTVNYNYPSGILLHSDSANILTGNTVNNNSWDGIILYGATSDTLTDNTINYNKRGIRLDYFSINNSITKNYFIENTAYGVYLNDSSKYNTFWGNTFIDNVVNAFEDESSTENDWNLSDTGNYWSDCYTNPGYPNYYEIPGPGDGIDYYPECPENNAPGLFSLLLPEDSALVPIGEVEFDWENSTDPDPWDDTIWYSLYISTSLGFNPDSTIIHDSLLTSNYSDTLDSGIYYWKAKALDKWGGETWSTQTWSFCAFLRGDTNGDGEINILDAVFLVNYVFKSGPPPEPIQTGDANCDGNVDVVDVVYLINYIFKSGPPPC